MTGLAVGIASNDFWEENERSLCMYLYWRIQQDLNCMGEFLMFRDPCFNRCFRDWMRRNATGLAMAEEWIWQSSPKSHLN